MARKTLAVARKAPLRKGQRHDVPARKALPNLASQAEPTPTAPSREPRPGSILPPDLNVQKSLKHVNRLLKFARTHSVWWNEARAAGTAAEVTSLRERVHELEGDLERVRDQAQAFETANSRQKGEIASLKTAHATAAAQLAALRQVQAVSATSPGMTAKQRSDLRSVPRLRDELRSAKSEIKDFKRKRRRLRDDMVGVVTGAEEAARLVCALDDRIREVDIRGGPRKLLDTASELEGVVQRFNAAVHAAAHELIPSDDEYTHAEY